MTEVTPSLENSRFQAFFKITVLRSPAIRSGPLVRRKGFAFLRKSHAGCGVPPAPRQVPAFESLLLHHPEKAKEPILLNRLFTFGTA